jgi:hypothetical protein
MANISRRRLFVTLLAATGAFLTGGRSGQTPPAPEPVPPPRTGAGGNVLVSTFLYDSAGSLISRTDCLAVTARPEFEVNAGGRTCWPRWARRSCPNAATASTRASSNAR